MKKYLVISIALNLISIWIISGCKPKDDFGEPPSITLDKTTVTAKVGDTVRVAICISTYQPILSIKADPSVLSLLGVGFLDDSKLFESGGDVNFKRFKEGIDEAMVYYIYIVPAQEDDIKLKFSIAEKTWTNTAVCTITVGQTPGLINTWASSLGGGTSTKGSYYGTASGIVFNQVDAINSASAVDLIYYYSTSAGFYAPNNSAINSTYTGWASATTKNATKFATTTISAGAFDLMTDDLVITNAAGAASADNVTGLFIGQVIAFKTAGGKLGLIKITAITGNNSGTISFVCKVQK